MTSGKGVDDLIKTLMKKKVKKVFLLKAPAVHVQLATNKITNYRMQKCPQECQLSQNK